MPQAHSPGATRLADGGIFGIVIIADPVDQMRALITQQLIQEKGFNAVIVEADWPDAYRVNRYVRGVNDDRDPNEALLGFKRFPQWMWRNQDVLEFVQWLRLRNDALPKGEVKRQ